MTVAMAVVVATHFELGEIETIKTTISPVVIEFDLILCELKVVGLVSISLLLEDS